MHYLNPATRAEIAMLLSADTDTLSGHDIASEATWADKYRDSDRDTTKIRYEATRLWHVVDIEVAEPNLASACFGHPPLPAGVPAPKGPPRASVVDKIDQFAAELSNPATNVREAGPTGPWLGMMSMKSCREPVTKAVIRCRQHKVPIETVLDDWCGCRAQARVVMAGRATLGLGNAAELPLTANSLEPAA